MHFSYPNFQIYLPVWLFISPQKFGDPSGFIMKRAMGCYKFDKLNLKPLGGAAINVLVCEVRSHEVDAYW